MAEQLSIQLDLQGVLKQGRFSGFGGIVAFLGMERALKSAGQAVARKARVNIRRAVKLRTGNLAKRVRVQGSARTRFIPSARIKGAPHLHLIERGHIIHVPVRGGGTRSTGKRSKAFRIVEKARQATRTQQNRALRRALDRELEKAQVAAISGNVNSERKALNYARRIAKREVNLDRRLGNV